VLPAQNDIIIENDLHKMICPHDMISEFLKIIKMKNYGEKLFVASGICGT